MDMRKDIVRTRNRKEEGTSNSAKARRKLRDQLLAKGAYTKVEFEIRIFSLADFDLCSRHCYNKDTCDSG